MLKKYKTRNWESKVWKNENGNHLINTCIECGSKLEVNTDFNCASEWTASYTCTKCGSKFAYQPSDMGQSLPWLVRYDNKEEVFEKP